MIGPALATRSARRQLPASSNGARDARRDRCGQPSLRQLLLFAALALISAVGGSPSIAEDGAKREMRSLDEQVQEVKSDVLGIAAELGQLEERLLYPSNTQVAVFVSLAEGETARVDSVQILIDGAPVARHVYSFKELEAMQKGGVQRIYTGNVSTGAHRLEISVAGKLPNGTDFSGSQGFDFSKGVEPKLVSLTLGGDGGAASIQLGSL